MVEDSGRGWRRVVPSPRPLRIVEISAIKELIANYVVISTGGGGIPVIERDGELKGVEAVIDKDLGASLLSSGIGADILLMSTGVKGVYLDYGKPSQRLVEKMSTEEARSYLEEGQFPEGSMGPKIEACIQFLENGGKRAIITSPALIPDALSGRAGTTMR
jgi:carbamate kinase